MKKQNDGLAKESSPIVQDHHKKRYNVKKKTQNSEERKKRHLDVALQEVKNTSWLHISFNQAWRHHLGSKLSPSRRLKNKKRASAVWLHIYPNLFDWFVLYIYIIIISLH